MSETDGIKTPDLPEAVAVDDLIGNFTFDEVRNTVRISIPALARLLSATTTIAGVGVDPRSYGATNDGVSGGQASYWALAAADAIAQSRPLVSAGVCLADQTIQLGQIRVVDLPFFTFREPAGGRDGVLVDLDCTGLTSSASRKSEICALGINVGPNSALGQYDFQGPQSQATGFRLVSDNGGNSYRRFWGNRLKCVLLLVGNSEKNEYFVHGIYNETLVRLDTTLGSPDTVVLHLNGTNNKRAYWPDDGDTSVRLILNTEGRIDDGAVQPCYWDAGATTRPVAYIEARNGKHFSIEGKHRAHNGRLWATDDRAYEDGADTVNWAIIIIHDYGTVYSNYRVQRLTGWLDISDSDDGRANFADVSEPPSLPCAAVHLRQVWDASDWRLHVSKVRNREAIRWGDAATPTLLSRGAHMGHYTGEMGSRAAIAFNPTRGIYPVGSVYLHIERAERCFAVLSILGDIVADAGSIDNRLEMENGLTWIRAGHRATAADGSTLPAGRLSLRLHGRGSIDDVFWRAWVFDGLSVEALAELGGPSERIDGRWTMPGKPITTLAQLRSASHWLNSEVKRLGASVWYGGKPIFASGPAPSDAWVDAAGDDVVASAEIVEEARTSAFAARVTAAGSSLTGTLRRAYDRMMFDLTEASLWDRLILLDVLAAQDRASARLNLVTGLSAAYDLTEVNSPTFLPFVGYQGNGVSSYLATGYNPTAASEGMATNDMHIGLWVARAGTSGGMDAGTRDNNRLRIQSTDDGLAYSTSDSGVVTASGTGGAPHHIVATRSPSPVGGRAYRNGLLVAQDALSPSLFMPTTIDLLRQRDSYSLKTISIAHVGRGLTADQVAALHRIFAKFLQQVQVD
jgi:hypothetical protein